jgi:hypothetical protein
MADTNHTHATAPVEGDGISYSGIAWFLVILVVTTLVCEVIIWVMFKGAERYRLARPEIVRAPLAAPAGTPHLADGRLVPGTENAPGPRLLVDEPINLRRFRDNETKALHSYGWVNEGTQTVRLTIDRAKELISERGLPAREQAPTLAAPMAGSAAAGTTVPAPAPVPTAAGHATPAPPAAPAAGH